ncbi:PocR ligand-binding domain-containing protein [Clostridium punense]|nr:hypothetical protein M918_07970 [Clostridium sp. BL8]
MRDQKDFSIENIEIKDVIDIDVLQKFQDNFAIGMDVASVTVDINGNPVTKPSSYTRFCESFTHSTTTGDNRCAESHRRGGEEATRTGRPYVYTCHAGLIDFAAPIMIDGVQIGTILGGQVLTDEPELLNYRKIAKEIGVDEEGYIDAVQEVKVTTEKNIKAAAEVLFIVANTLSKVGYDQLRLGRMSQELTDNFSQIAGATQELAATSISVIDNHHTLNDEILNVQSISIEINSILDSIKSIADETKMLGLNAAIEAARAGEAGRGFGVVATEIRNLSQSSKETAQQITKLTSRIQESVSKTLKLSGSTIESTEQQSAAIEETNASVEEVMSLAELLNKIANNS